MHLLTLGPDGTILVPFVGLSDAFIDYRVPHCTLFGTICGIVGLCVGCEVPTGTPFGMWVVLKFTPFGTICEIVRCIWRLGELNANTFDNM